MPRPIGVCKQLGLELDVHARVEGLSVAEQTMLAIAKALFSNAKLIVLDEPTAALPRPEVDRLFGFVRSLKTHGVAFIYISHHLEEVFEICDRVTVLRNGRLVETRPVAGLDTPMLIRLMVGEDVQEFKRDSAAAVHDEEVMTVRGLVRRGHYEDISFTLHRGEVIGLAGLEGSGASSLAKGLFGLQRLGHGEVMVGGSRLRRLPPTLPLPRASPTCRRIATCTASSARGRCVRTSPTRFCTGWRAAWG